MHFLSLRPPNSGVLQVLDLCPFDPVRRLGLRACLFLWEWLLISLMQGGRKCFSLVVQVLSGRPIRRWVTLPPIFLWLSLIFSSTRIAGFWGYRGVEYKFFYFQLRTKSSECDAVKLQPIINYNCLGNSEPTNDVFPNKLSDVLIFDVSISFHLYPFVEIVNGHEQEFLLRGYD